MDVEGQVQKHLVTFCKALPVHVSCWRSVIQDAAKPLQTLANLCEQRRHVTAANLKTFDEFEDAQSQLLYQISCLIEEEFLVLKELINKLSKSCNDLKNKLLTFERSTLTLDWEENSELIRGSGFQPPLSRLLQDGLEFSNFLGRSAKNISDRFKSLNLDDEKAIRELQASFDVNLDDGIVGALIALTQYVDNVKAIL
ncbi:uncharacterized protein LOC135139381 [Zophobas morio]|uniref:uncharacterized protein LOC135139381 n=1 Tax=Zophobas morio TaxID=2755281 RepID=UPI00308342E1